MLSHNVQVCAFAHCTMHCTNAWITSIIIRIAAIIPQIVEEPAFGGVVLNAGESLISISAAGGGYGPPRSRPASTVAANVREGRVSRQRARDTYGVVLTSDSVVDESRTNELRTALAAAGASTSTVPN